MCMDAHKEPQPFLDSFVLERDARMCGTSVPNPGIRCHCSGLAATYWILSYQFTRSFAVLCCHHPGASAPEPTVCVLYLAR